MTRPVRLMDLTDSQRRLVRALLAAQTAAQGDKAAHEKPRASSPMSRANSTLLERPDER